MLAIVRAAKNRQ